MKDNPAQIQWKKSSSCLGGSQCVEVAQLEPGVVGVRDSKDPAGPALAFAAVEWSRFLRGLRAEMSSRL